MISTYGIYGIYGIYGHDKKGTSHDTWFTSCILELLQDMSRKAGFGSLV